MPVLKLAYRGEPLNCSISKVDRARLYGYRKTEVLDGQGRVCQPVTLGSDGRTLIPSGGVALAYLSPQGSWRDKSGLQAVDMSGNPIEGVGSTFKTVVELDEETTVESLLDHDIRMVYELNPEEDFSFPDSLLEELSDGRIYSFPFSYRGGLTADTAFVLRGEDENVWMLIGQTTRIELLSYEQAKGVAEETEDEEDDEDLDFNLF